jgi:octaprenyl-diphosphate synthase
MENLKASEPAIQKPSLAKLQALVLADLKQVDEVIIANIGSDVPLIPQLARHIIASGGKRLRPALTLLSAKMCGYVGARHVHLAACVEFIHTATLLHDDVVDESALRRGSATANDIWGNKASVLVGDFLLSRAFQLMVSDGSLKVLKILSDASAVIAQGEVLQLSTANNMATTKEQYLDVITAKTATLFAAACELGAVVNERDELEKDLSAAGLALGIAFQIMDDTLDYVPAGEALGKSIGDDFRDGKITLPVIIAYERGSEEEKTFWKRTQEEQEFQDGDLERAMALIAQHNAIEDSILVAEEYSEKARQLIAKFAPSDEKEAMLDVIDFCTHREF